METWREIDWRHEAEPDYRLWARQHGRVVTDVLTGPSHLLAIWTDANLYHHARQAARYGLEAMGERQ